MQIFPQYITRDKTSVISNKVAVKFIDVYFPTFLLIIAIVFSKGNISGFSWLSLAYDFSVRLFPPPRTLRARFSALHQFLSFSRRLSGRARRPFFSRSRASRRYRDLRPVKRGNEQDVDNDDTLTRSAHRFLLLATGINSGRARSFSSLRSL